MNSLVHGLVLDGNGTEELLDGCDGDRLLRRQVCNALVELLLGLDQLPEAFAPTRPIYNSAGIRLADATRNSMAILYHVEMG